MPKIPLQPEYWESGIIYISTISPVNISALFIIKIVYFRGVPTCTHRVRPACPHEYSIISGRLLTEVSGSKLRC